ncbi:putative uncharacterized protein DDB_G0290521 [Liolophura sinensis]|uniref:putative uncharacterized protein DDB_G0290521 n=1 Tax=Liolophura sinensis TaxID=3198878 RepID=UPI003158C260
MIKKRATQDEDPVYYASIEGTYNVVKRAHIATGHGGRDRMVTELKKSTDTPTQELTPTTYQEPTPTTNLELTPTKTQELTPTTTQEPTPTTTQELTPTTTQEPTPTTTQELTPTTTQEPTQTTTQEPTQTTNMGFAPPASLPVDQMSSNNDPPVVSSDLLSDRLQNISSERKDASSALMTQAQRMVKRVVWN